MTQWLEKASNNNFPIYLIECIDLLGGRDKVTTCWRYETNQFMGIFMVDEKGNCVLPADKTRRGIIAVLNNYIINVEKSVADYERDTIII